MGPSLQRDMDQIKVNFTKNRQNKVEIKSTRINLIKL